MKNIKLIVEYDGSNYFGWQRQNNAITIQQVIEDAIFKLTGEKLQIIGSSRTDTGVHAKGFVCNFKTESTIPPERFREALNTKLPEDIVIVCSEEVNENFHSRYDSKGKTYVYSILNREEPVAIGRNYVYHYKKELDIDKMRQGAKYFIGTHDFAAFRNIGGSVKTSVRTITQLDIEKKDDLINIIVSADGFLYNMVRIIVGTLLRVGTGKYEPEKIQYIMESKDRTKAGKSAPANGLCLLKVIY